MEPTRDAHTNSFNCIWKVSKMNVLFVFVCFNLYHLYVFAVSGIEIADNSIKLESGVGSV